MKRFTMGRGVFDAILLVWAFFIVFRVFPPSLQASGSRLAAAADQHGLFHFPSRTAGRHGGADQASALLRILFQGFLNNKLFSLISLPYGHPVASVSAIRRICLR